MYLFHRARLLAATTLVLTYAYSTAVAARTPLADLTTADLSNLPSVTIVAPKPPTAKQLAGESVPHFIEAHGMGTPTIHELARWYSGICPKAYGMSQEFDDFVTARILSIARRVGAPVPTAAHARCRVNIEVFFTTEPEQTLTLLAKKSPAILGYHHSGDLRKLLAFTLPIEARYMTATKNNFNGYSAPDEFYPNLVPGQIGCVRCLRPPGRIDTRLATDLSSLVQNVLVIVNLRQVAGRTAGEVSDYVAMIALSPTQAPASCGKLPSILDEFAKSCDTARPDAITAGDMAYLRALYAVDLEESLHLEQADIGASMMRQFGSVARAQ